MVPQFVNAPQMFIWCQISRLPADIPELYWLDTVFRTGCCAISFFKRKRSSRDSQEFRWTKTLAFSEVLYLPTFKKNTESFDMEIDSKDVILSNFGDRMSGLPTDCCWLGMLIVCWGLENSPTNFFHHANDHTSTCRNWFSILCWGGGGTYINKTMIEMSRMRWIDGFCRLSQTLENQATKDQTFHKSHQETCVS